MTRKVLRRSRRERVFYRVLDPNGVQWHGRQVPQGEIVAASPVGEHVHIKRWLAKKRVLLVVQKKGKAIPGVCSKCGCTWADACPGGCAWVNSRRTLCSSHTVGGLARHGGFAGFLDFLDL